MVVDIGGHGDALSCGAQHAWVEGTPGVRPLNDHEYVALAQRGDHDAFSALVRRYQDRIYRFILRMSGCREEALDLTQETFLKAYQGLGAWQADAQFRTWLFRIATNTSLDVLRRRKVVFYVPIDESTEIVDQSVGPERRAQDQQSFAALEVALDRIPPLYREALLLRELDGMSYGEIAETLNVTEGTVKSRIARARTGLLEIMERGGHARGQK